MDKYNTINTIPKELETC